MQKYLIDWANHKKVLFVCWWICFFYTAFVAVFVQFIFLPHIAPSLHIGGGFMAELDCSTFHRFAVELAEKIRENGWHEWKLDPGVGTGLSGIAAIFYTLFVPELWVMIPFNAFVHATSGLLIILIGYEFFERLDIAVVSAVPFIVLPSAALWYTQLHKDGLIFLGWFMVFYAVVLVFSFSNHISLKSRLLQIILLLCLGYFSFITAKPYHAQVFIGFSVAVTTLMTLLLLMELVKHGRIGKRQFLSYFVYIVISVVLVISQKSSFNFPDYMNSSSSGANENISLSKKIIPAPERSSPSLSNDALDANSMSIKNDALDTNSMKKENDNNFFEFFKRKQVLVLNKGKNIILNIHNYRNAYINNAAHTDAKSNIDLNVNFHSFSDLVMYFPRALQIGLFAPFPNKWFEKGRVPANTLMKRIAVFEMMIVYTGLIGIPLLFLLNKFTRKKELMILLSSCLFVMIPLIFIMTNVGIIYRVRYGFLMLLVGIGFAGFMKFVFERKNELSPESLTS